MAQGMGGLSYGQGNLRELIEKKQAHGKLFHELVFLKFKRE